MKIEYVESCFSNRLTVDGVDINEMSASEQRVVLDKLIEHAIKCSNGSTGERSVIMDLLNVYGDMEFDNEACDQCGHTGSTTKIEI